MNDEKMTRGKSADTEAARQERLERAQLHFMEEWRAGARPTVEGYVRDYPDLADELLDFILTFVEVEAALERTPETVTASPEAIGARSKALAGPCGLLLSVAEVRMRQGITLGKFARELGMPTLLASRVESGDLTDWPSLVETEVSRVLQRPIPQVQLMLRSPPPQVAAHQFHAHGQPTEGTRKQRTWEDALKECEESGPVTEAERRKWWVKVDG